MMMMEAMDADDDVGPLCYNRRAGDATDSCSLHSSQEDDSLADGDIDIDITRSSISIIMHTTSQEQGDVAHPLATARMLVHDEPGFGAQTRSAHIQRLQTR